MKPRPCYFCGLPGATIAEAVHSDCVRHADCPKPYHPVVRSCDLCGAGDSRWGTHHHPSCIYRWHPDSAKTVVVRLNAYQAANLLWALKMGWTGRIQEINTGDWVGEIPQQLEAMMRQAGGEFLTYRANATGDDPLPVYMEPKTLA